MGTLFIPWDPVKVVPPGLDIADVHDADTGLIVELNAVNEVVTLTFAHVLAHRLTDEAFRHRTREMMSSASFPWRTFFQVENSDFLHWFHLESKEMLTSRRIKHYCIFTQTDCLDVLSETDPSVS